MAKRLKIFVSSTVYGFEELLNRIYTLLTSFGYEVLMSHKGTVPVSSKETAFESCLRGVEECDLFLGVITPKYGTGKSEAESRSITHLEMLKAVELHKPRWFLAHNHVVFARSFLKDLGYKNREDRKNLALKKAANSIEDLKVIDLYEDVTLEGLPLEERQGNWVQKFETDDDANLFVIAQFSKYLDVEAILTENFEDIKQIAQVVGGE
ncbi:DUF4062 domain-containing protein [Acinetobacter baumannii]